MTVYDLLQNVKAVNEALRNGELMRGVLELHENEILDAQRHQLFEGKASSGDDLRPYYSEDLKGGGGFFKSTESAERYRKFKLNDVDYPGNASPYLARRNPDAPNLYIKGKFHRELGVRYNSKSMTIDGSTAWSARIVRKYGLDSFGLSNENWSELLHNGGIYQDLLKEIRKMIYGN